ncbi:hypothetical protein K0M31_003385 [Melipona bicolor]|uniref:Uncharacterized protein n=1 Tax=Melipona bicolor TaxID=60889 RepID=A0AA40FZS2_9HYME|nr:hypothetical protein K0M31_003385 [Melipona bicolor]
MQTHLAACARGAGCIHTSIAATRDDAGHHLTGSPLMKLLPDQQAATEDGERERDARLYQRAETTTGHCPCRTLGTRWLGSGPLPPWINCHAKTHDG